MRIDKAGQSIGSLIVQLFSQSESDNRDSGSVASEIKNVPSTSRTRFLRVEEQFLDEV